MSQYNMYSTMHVVVPLGKEGMNLFLDFVLVVTEGSHFSKNTDGIYERYKFIKLIITKLEGVSILVAGKSN